MLARNNNIDYSHLIMGQTNTWSWKCQQLVNKVTNLCKKSTIFWVHPHFGLLGRILREIASMASPCLTI